MAPCVNNTALRVYSETKRTETGSANQSNIPPLGRAIRGNKAKIEVLNQYVVFRPAGFWTTLDPSLLSSTSCENDSQTSVSV
jgi:hypothetical protein